MGSGLRKGGDGYDVRCMCGIAGLLELEDRSPDRGRLARMLAQVRHRGPDGGAISIHGRCGLALAQLSIVDPQGGAQPMHLDGSLGTGGAGGGGSLGRLHVVFNGEIYNHRYLRGTLERRGHVFRTNHSDTEVLLLGYREWGHNLPRHLHGMFAFAVWDEDEGTLFLCRDRMGKKPLLYRREGKGVAFASTLGGVIAGGGGVALSPSAVLSFLRLGHTLGGSLIAEVASVPPAHWVKVDRGGSLETARYWRPPPISKTSTATGAVQAVLEVLGDAVSARLEADVPLGLFLSGGLDSALVAAVAQGAMAERGLGTLRTFTVAMPGMRHDPSGEAAATAKHIGSHHTLLHATAASVMDDLRRLVAAAGSPAADPSILTIHWLCRAASDHVKVALTGDGGDELFGGYERYGRLRHIERHGWWMRAVPQGLMPDREPSRQRMRLGRTLWAAKPADDPASRYARMIELFTASQIAEMGIDKVSPLGSASDPDHEADGEPDSGWLPDWPSDEADTASAAMRWDLLHDLPGRVLPSLDTGSMAVPLEVRCPLLDTGVCDLASHLPARVLMPNGKSKGLLRQVARGLLPRSIADARKPSLTVPLGGWFRGELADPLRDLLLGPSLNPLGIDRRFVGRLLDEHADSRRDHTLRLFALTQLALWLDWLGDPTAA